MRVMDVGIFQGGSLVLFDKLFRPEKLVGLDVRRQPIEALDNYARSRSHIKIYYGRSQDKVGTVMAARQNFPRGIDLVVDDASHQYAKSKATFEMLYPLVVAGGYYVIEDWAWSHKPAYQATGATWAAQPALTNLVFELLVLAGVHSAVENVLVTAGLVAIRKGVGILPPEPFELKKYLRGKNLTLI